MEHIKSNYHTHTELCKHAKGMPVDFAQKAVEFNVQILGISDHAPFKDVDFGYRMLFSELDLYCDAVDKAKSYFSDKVEILKSLEIEYLPEYTKGKNYYEELLTERKMDYLLLGEHFFRDSQGNLHNITSIQNTELAVEYAESCAEAMKTGYFKIMAHPDLFCINEPFPWNDNYERCSDILIENAVKNNVVLEYNANGLRRGKKNYPDGKRFQYPHERFWKKVKDAGLSAVAGSDAHNPDILWDNAVETSIKTLAQLGINRIEKIKL